MCLPLVLAAATAGLSFLGQTQAATAQTKLATQVQQQAQQSFRMQQSFMAQRYLQLQAASSQQAQTKAIEAAQAEGQIRTGAAESGASGLNLDALVGDINRQLGYSTDAIDYNRKIQSGDIQNSVQNDYYQMLDRRNSVPMGVQPSFLTPILSTASAGLDLYAKDQQTQQQTQAIRRSSQQQIQQMYSEY